MTIQTASFEDFQRLDMRAGTVTSCVFNAKARKPAYVLEVDFGPEIGTLKTSSQITQYYKPEELIGRQIVGCINIGSRQIANVMSQFLALGFADANGQFFLCHPLQAVPNGTRMC